MNDKTLQYYNSNADDFIAGTIGADVSALYDRFEPHLSQRARVLDLGCGSGRDSVHFIKKGYDVEAIDGSQALCDKASKLIGRNVRCMLFGELDYHQEFDGIWACASLLHVPKRDMNDVIGRLWDALKPGGVLYASYKYGDEERWQGERKFSDYSEKDLDKLFPEADWEVIDWWISEDVRADRSVAWLNILARKKSGAPEGSTYD